MGKITRPLNERGQVVLNGSGNGTVSLGPLSILERWKPDNVHVQVSTDTNEAVCYIYVGDVAQQRNFRDATSSGSLGDSSSRVNNDVLTPPMKVWAVWSGGDPGAIATLNVTGVREIVTHG